MTWRRPDDMDPLVAVGMPAAAQTALDALFNCLGFGFPSAGLAGDDATGKAILIWGGGSNVGAAAVQIAKAAGFDPILVTASKHNHGHLRNIGATQCFDYHEPSVVTDIQEAVRASGKSLRTAFDAVCAGLGIYEGLSHEARAVVEEKYDESTPALARKCMSIELSPEDLRLSCVLPVVKDPDWKFALVPRGSLGDSSPQDWAERTDKAMAWFIANHRSVWRSMPKVKVVGTAEDAITVIHDVWEGKTSMEKVVLRHPLL